MMPNKHIQDTAQYPDLPVLTTGLAARCPRCGEGKLYQSMLKPVSYCAVCGLDMSFAEEGDGPAVLVIMLLGFVITGLAVGTFYAFNPPIWVHVILWLPLTLFLSIYALRAMKGIMIAAQYKTQAAEGILDHEGSE